MRLDVRDEAIATRDEGAAIIPGNAKDSAIIRRPKGWQVAEVVDLDESARLARLATIELTEPDAATELRRYEAGLASGAIRPRSGVDRR